MNEREGMSGKDNSTQNTHKTVLMTCPLPSAQLALQRDRSLWRGTV